MNNLYIMEAANLVCGDGGEGTTPGISTHLSIMDLKLPGLEENFNDHYPGGAQVGIEIPMFTNRLEATFTLAGWQPDVMKMMGSSWETYQWFTAYGLIRERRTGQALEAKAVMQGRLGRVNPTAYRKGDVMNHEFSIRSIIHYELYMQEAGQPRGGADSEIYWWDFFESTRKIGGVDVNSDLNDILRINAITAENITEPGTT